MRYLACAALAGASVIASASNLDYFQFRKLSTLPGAAFGVTVDGLPSIDGAMAFSTPIGFSLKGDVYDIGFASRSDDNAPEMINFKKRAESSSGIGQGEVGFSTPIGNITAVIAPVSSDWDQIYSGQIQLPLHLKDGGVSVGAQNITNRPEGDKCDRSLFAVGTYEVQKGDYVSLGFGNNRFNGVFGNACALVTPRLKATLEYDTLSFNGGLAYSFGKIKGLGDYLDKNELTLWAGYVQMHYCTVAINWAF